jgi:probable HAF family extracellular repeat protein
MKKSSLFIIAFIYFFSGGYLHAASNYVLIDLGTVGNDWSRAESINNNGVIVGNTGDAAFKMVPYPKKGLPVGRMVLLEYDYAGGSPVVRLRASSINDENEIAGTAHFADEDLDHAIMWLPDGDDPTYLTNADYVTDINNYSKVIGADGFPEDPFSFLWDDGVTIIASWALNGMLDSSPSAINNKGLIVGYGRSSDDEDAGFACLWKGGGIVDLNTFPHDSDGYLAYARDINNLGQIVGDYEVTEGGGSVSDSSFLISSGNVRDIGFEGASAINDKGQIVGSHFLYENLQRFDASGRFHEFGGRLYNLNRLIKRQVRPFCFGSALTGTLRCFYIPIEYENLVVQDINDSGRIVGSATIDAAEHAVLLNPIIPKKAILPGK